ncbi:DUF2624 family protein [Chryseobacterium sp. Leaf180]|uniref:DUF2624 family protein n=1 Tax=Chryseobacterium sp. Leaf180 TaxID=1736289 RepID=UPI000A62C9B3|nr:DUF2624 family protein [Chryseobacterium sp. Leaf180]
MKKTVEVKKIEVEDLIAFMKKERVEITQEEAKQIAAFLHIITVSAIEFIMKKHNL